MAIYYLDYVNGNDSNDGSTWALAWKTLTSGPTDARVGPGDVVRIAKSPDPTSCGINATFTDRSKNVSLASALTKDVDMCESAWTPSTNVTDASTGTRKQGTYSRALAIAAAFTTGKIAYKALGSSQDFSAYQQLSFWIRANATVNSGVLQVCLCSDTAGNTVVDSFTVPVNLYATQWTPLVIDSGAALGSAIQSVALYALSDAPAVTINIDDIIACKAPGNDALSLVSLIGKNSAGEGWYAIQSISGTTVMIDNGVGTTASNGQGYCGTTETVTLYKRETIKTPPVSTTGTVVQQFQPTDAVVNSKITFSCGWNTGTTEQDGETWFDGQNGFGYGLYATAKSFLNFERLCACRYYYPFYFTNCQCFEFTDCKVCSGEVDNIAHYSCTNFKWTNLISVNAQDSCINFRTGTGDRVCAFVDVYDSKFLGGIDDGADPTAIVGLRFFNCLFDNNLTADIDIDDIDMVDCYNCQLLSTTPIALVSTVKKGCYLSLHNHQGVAGRHLTYYGFNGYASWWGRAGDHVSMGQAANWARGGTGTCLVLHAESSTAGREFLYEFIIPVTASTPVKLSMYVRRTGSGGNTTVNCTIFDSDDNATKLVNEGSVTLSDSWAEWQSAQFTPTHTGFCRVQLKITDGTTSCDIGIDDVSVVTV